MERINSADLSIVVQGTNIAVHTPKCLQSLRQNFPDAEIIFSTYENENIDNLDFDILVKSKDPGATHMHHKMYNNINRILTTTQAGLREANRKYCLKMRSDLICVNDKLLENLIAQFPKREEEFSVFKQRIMFYALWTRKSEYIADRFFILSPFYLSDWMCFGLTEDIKNYFMHTPLTPEPKFTNYFKVAKHRKLGFWNPDITWKFSPEQYFATSFFKKYFPQADMESLQDVTPEKMEFSRRVFANNVVICGYRECGFGIQKKPYIRAAEKINTLYGKWLGGVYRYGDFLADYKKYCDPTFKIPFYYVWTSQFYGGKEIEKISKHFNSFIKPFRPFLKWFEQIFSLVYYCFKILLRGIAASFHALTQK